jgi:bifunctional non-homologous end joining protein LigD
VNDELALLWMVNTGCIEAHIWYSRIDRLERPDWVIFDLDPADDVGFAETAQVALLVKRSLDALGLVAFPKTSGALGLHILVPIERRHTYDDTRRFATEVARAIAGAHADLATTEWSKAKRRGVLIDASQNAKGKSIASVYSVRPMPGATVSTPLDWHEVNETLDPSIYTMEAVLERLDRHGDLYAGVLKTKQRLGPALRAVGN